MVTFLGGNMYRIAIEEDIEKLLDIIKEYDEQLESDAKEELIKLIRGENSDVILSCDTATNEIKAFIAYKTRAWGAEDIYWFEWLFVNTRFKGYGNGKLIYDYVEQLVKEMGARKIYVDIEDNGSEFDLRAKNFHIRNGYTHEATLVDFWGIGRDYVLMSKVIKDE